MKTFLHVQRYVRGWDSWQVLYKTWTVFGIPVFRRAIDREEVPRHVYIQFITMGDWYGWKSEFYEHIK